MSLLTRVFIPDDNGEGRRVQLFMAGDGDIHISILEQGERLTRKSVRVCTGQGNPKHREIWKALRKVFDEAEKAGYIEEA